MKTRSACCSQAQTCLVIGAASGIGQAVLARLTADGITCQATGHKAVPAHDVGEHGPTDSEWLLGDVRNPEAIGEFIEAAITGLGRLHALVYCPAIAEVGAFEQLTPEQWTEVFEVNTRGFALAVRAALPHWRKIGHGRAVVLSSQAARRGQPLISAYTASKAALEGLVRALAVELAPVVRVNAVAPGIVNTAMIEEDFRRQASAEGVDAEEIRRRTVRRIPLGAFQQADSVAAVVGFLLGPATADITGQVIAVDGGMTA